MATPATLARMQVDLVANTAPFDRDMKRAEATLGKFSNDASRFFARYEAGQTRAIQANNLSAASREQMGNTSAATFSRIQQDVELATQDFERGVISVQDYNAALSMARSEAQQLKSTGIQPMGKELSAFNSIMRATGGQTRTSGRSFGILRRSMGSLAARAVGLNGTIGTVLSSLSGFALPALTTAGIFAGVAALGLALKGIRDDAKEAAEKVGEFISSFDPLAGQISNFEQLEAAQERLEKLRRDLERARGPTQIIGFGPEGPIEQSVETGDIVQAQEIEQEIQTLERAIKNFRDQLGQGGDETGASLTTLNQRVVAATSGLGGVVNSLQVAAPVIDDHAERLRRATEDLALPGAALAEGPRRLVRRDQFPDMQFAGEAGGFGELEPIRLARVNADIRAAGEAMEDTGDEANKAAEVAIAGFGGVVEAFARGAANMEQVAVSAFTKIAQSLTGGGVFGAVIGAVGGIIGGLFARNNRPAPVRVEDFGSRAESKMNRQTGPERVQVLVVTPEGVKLADIEHDLNRRSQRDASSRIPSGVRISGG